MPWHTDYLTSRGKSIGKTVDENPYLAPLLLATNIGEKRLISITENLNRLIKSQRIRPTMPTTSPCHLVVDISDVCNLQCPLCVQSTHPQGRTKGYIQPETVVSLCNELQDSLIRVELFNWGEPLLNPNVYRIVENLSSRSVFSRVSSNLSIKRSLDFGALVASGLNWAVASIDGSSQEIYQRYRVGGDLELVLSNLQKLVDARNARGSAFPIIEWQFLALNHNTHEIESARSLATSIGVDIFRYGGARGVMRDRINVPTKLNYETSKDYLLATDHPLSEYINNGEKAHKKEEVGCRWLWGYASVHSDGGVSPCWTYWDKETDLGSLSEQSFFQIWNGDAFGLAREVATKEQLDDVTGLPCHNCSKNKLFVNTPESLGPTFFDIKKLEEVYSLLSGLDAIEASKIVYKVLLSILKTQR